jgi:putative aldouronate transport system permease protein
MAQNSLAQSDYRPLPDAAPAGFSSKAASFQRIWRQHWMLYALLLPPLLLILFLRVYPLWGISIAFVDFNPVKGIGGSEWVALDHFKEMFRRPEMIQLIRNTLLISLGKIFLGEIAGLCFALLLYEVQFPAFRRVVQTIATFPHFFSWVIVGSMALMILGSNGLVNHTLMALGLDRVRFLADKFTFPYTLIGSDVWKEFGWSSVIYLAALTQIHPDLLEAAAVDGAGRGGRIWHIVMPCILPTFIFMLVLGFGSILDAGMDQVLVLYNPAVYATGDILDTYVYRMGMVNSKFEIATVVGVVKAFVGFAAILIANWVSVKVANRSLF